MTWRHAPTERSRTVAQMARFDFRERSGAGILQEIVSVAQSHADVDPAGHGDEPLESGLGRDILVVDDRRANRVLPLGEVR